VLRLLAGAAVALSIAVRLWHRDGLYTGWDVLGIAEGERLLATLGPGDLLAHLHRYRFDASLTWNCYGVLLTIVPGALNRLHPWPHWATLTTLVFTAAAFALAAWAALPAGRRWYVLLGLGASGALLSFAVCGFAYGSAFWPYAVALAVVLRGRRLLPSLLGALVALEMAWHVQDLGPTVFVVFLLGAVARAGAPWRLRVLWLAAGVAGASLAFAYPPAIVRTGGFVPSLARLLELAPGVVAVLLGPLRPDVPILLPLALVALALVRRDRWLWIGLFGFQLALVGWLAAQEGPDRLWPRRLLLLDAVAVLVVAVAAADRARWRPLLLGALAVANVWQLAETLAWARAPRDPEGNGWTWPLPYTHTTLDFQVPLSTVAWTEEILRDVRAGRTVLVLYNLSSYQENATNPTAVPERLYVTLGHERFLRSVLLFGSMNERQHRFPVRPLEEIGPVLDGIRDPTQVVVHSILHPGDGPEAKAEFARIREAVEARFRVVPAPGGTAPTGGEVWQRGTLAPLEPAV
jgi:hypothetical protein